MTPWLRPGKSRGSLRRWLLLGYLLPLALVAVVATTVQWAGAYLELAGQQDERLVQSLGVFASAEPAPERALPVDMYFRVSAMAGERIAGQQALPPCPWAADLVVPGPPALYWAHVDGLLLRVAAARLPGDRIVQVAEAWSGRWPRWGDRWSAPLRVLYPSLAFLACMAWLLGRMLAARLRRAEAAVLIAPAAEAGDGDVPAELAPLIDRTRSLVREQQAWVDEQRRFLADASHQLRTPMSVLRAQLQAAMAGDVPAQEVFDQMLHTVDRAAGLANQLLSLTRIEQVKRQGGLPMVDVREVARNVVIDLGPLIAAKRLDVSLDEGTFLVPADATMLGELLRNLLANAIHHAPERARVGVVLREGAGRYELIVWDEGPGIDDAVRPRLFHPFAAGKGGVGLGLSICRQIAEAMGARVDLHNRCDAGTVIGVDAVVAWGQAP